MIIGVPKEIKDQEYRVAITPVGVGALVQSGHQVLVQAGAGEGSGISDDDFRQTGAAIAAAMRPFLRIRSAPRRRRSETEMW